MQLSNSIRQRILNLCNIQNITLHQLSLKAGIAYSTLSSFMNKTKSTTVTTLLHICEGFEIDLKTFFDSELFIDVIDEND